MVSIRRATIDDLPAMQNCNLWCLPENYTAKYYFYHYLNWSQLLYVAEDFNGKIVGYVLAKIDEESDDINGHITSLSVLRTHRKLGIAYQLMSATHKAMQEVFNADYCSLHVRVSNRAALGLYEGKLKYLKMGVEEKYYADDEDAFIMKKFFKETPELKNFLKRKEKDENKNTQTKSEDQTGKSGSQGKEEEERKDAEQSGEKSDAPNSQAAAAKKKKKKK